MGEPSIIERNARIIKWLIKCRNVPAPIPSSGSTGQLMKLAASATPASVSVPVRTGAPPSNMNHINNNSVAPLRFAPLQQPAAVVAVPVIPPASPFYGQSTRL